MLSFIPQVKKFTRGIIFVILILNFLGCKEQKITKARNKYNIVATTGMVADVVKNVGGDFVQVETLMGSDVDPHLYKASPADIYKMNRAKVIFYNGLHLEGKMADVLEKYSFKKTTFALASEMNQKEILGFKTKDGLADPHIWMDVNLWSITAAGVAKVLSKLDPKHKKQYYINAKNYMSKLKDLDQECRLKIAQIPISNRILITAHDAFRYFGRAYHFNVLGIQGISTESEAGLNEINRLVETIVDHKIRTVFIETSVSPRNIEALIEGARSHHIKVQIGGKLFSDAIGKSDTPEGSYIGMIRHNINEITKGLL